MKVILIIMCIVLILVNAFNIDYDNLTNWTKNKSYMLNLIIGVLLLSWFVFFEYKK